jgi:hypothetical protein
LALFRVIPEPEREPGPHRRGGNGGFYGLIGLLLAFILVGRWAGPVVLAGLLVAAGGFLLWSRRK